MLDPISIVLPIYNEEENIESIILSITLYFRKKNTKFEIIAVNDGSTDSSSKILKHLEESNLRIINHPKNLGYGTALMSGILASRNPWIFIMDCDRQFVISEFDKLISFVNDYDIVAGYRKERMDPFYRRLFARIYSILFFLLFGIKLKDINCGFKLLKRKVFKGINLRCKGGIIAGEILVKSKQKYKIKEVAVTHFPRIKGRQTGADFKVIIIGLKDLFLLWREARLKKIYKK